MFLALIRPAKKYLMDNVKKNGWDAIKDLIWVKEDKEDQGFQFKKAHAIAYALGITLLIRKD